jgi:hypothetical protein
MQDHAFNTCVEPVDSTPATDFFASSSDAPLLAPYAHAMKKQLLSLWRLRRILEVAVFREDTGERFVHNIVCGCVDESGVLIDRTVANSSSRTEALMWRIWLTSRSGIVVPLDRWRN